MSLACYADKELYKKGELPPTPICVCAAQVGVSEEGSTWGVERLLHVS